MWLVTSRRTHRIGAVHDDDARVWFGHVHVCARMIGTEER